MEEFEKFYNKALKFLSYRPRSEKEIRDKLFQKKTPQDLIEKIVSKLKEQKFINDEEFAKLWIESRNRSKPRSLRLIKLELKRKGIEGDIIDKMTNDEGLMIKDLESAKKLVAKRMARLKGLDRQKIYEKLGRFLASKGFGWDTIKQVIDEVLSEGV
ncbi:MAG: regulatory protein RecX [Candidatus Levybacteria bacterium]|nr:regulatory protein RecX [Candidatus Levybacteria bacterium]